METVHPNPNVNNILNMKKESQTLVALQTFDCILSVSTGGRPSARRRLHKNQQTS